MFFHKRLLPYQRAGVKFCIDRFQSGSGVLLADEMGLGKTAQALGVISAEPTIAKALIVCPASLIQNWHEEMRTWVVPSFKSRPFARIHVTSFEQMSKAPIDNDIMIVDEAHRLKNPESKRSQKAIEYAERAKRVLFLTGSPMPNGRPLELWMLLMMLDPKYWNANEGSFSEYKKRYCGPRSICINWRRQANPASWRIVYDGATNLDELNARLRATVMMRRTKSDVLTELPEKRTQVLALPGASQESDIFAGLDGIEDYDACIRRLRGSKVLMEEWAATRHRQGVEKVPAVIEHVENVLLEERKVVLFAHHQDVIEMLREGLAAHSPVLLNGLTAMGARQALIERFQTDEKCRVFIGSIGAAGVGFTLTAAHNVVFAELDPVPGIMSQAADRCHRIGQKSSVLVQHLVFDKTLDAHIVKLLVKKQERIDKTLRGSAGTT